jgi:hypothetical protein
VQDKALAIVADTTGVVIVQGSVAITNLAVTRDVTLSGLRGTSVVNANMLSVYALRVSNALGSVRVTDCRFSGSAQPSYCHPHSDGALVQNSQDVVFTRTLLTGAAQNMLHVLPGSSDFQHAGYGLLAIGSRIALYDCALEGGDAGQVVTSCVQGYGYTDDDGADGGHAVHALSSILFVGGTSLTGGRGGDADPAGCGRGGRGGNGVQALASLGLYALDDVVLPGAGGLGHDSGSGFPCSHPDGLAGSTFTPEASTFAAPMRHAAIDRVGREGGTVTLVLQGVPGDSVELLLGDDTAFQLSTQLRGVSTMLRARMGMAQPVLLLGTLPASGSMTVNWNLGDLGSGVQDRVLHLQPAFTNPNGRVTLGTPQTLVLLDSAF